MMKKLMVIFVGLLLLILFVSGSFALTQEDFTKINPGVEYQDGWFVGVFYKEASTGCIYKYSHEDENFIYLELYEDGTAQTGKYWE